MVASGNPVTNECSDIVACRLKNDPTCQDVQNTARQLMAYSISEQGKCEIGEF
jgi:hypothetical protein